MLARQMNKPMTVECAQSSSHEDEKEEQEEKDQIRKIKEERKTIQWRMLVATLHGCVDIHVYVCMCDEGRSKKRKGRKKKGE